MLQQANVSHGKSKFDKVVRRRELPCDRRSRALYSGQELLMVCFQCRRKEKSGEEARKRQRKGLGREFLLTTAPAALISNSDKTHL
jgi:hypothetical protein